MHVEQIILEGFKTYVNRTVISGFDPQFNAITGFNGSGKSNILDAIQFLLGSTNKQMLRLKSNITEVIYKEGCSGIQKASVSIKFRCIDKSLRPTGYESNEELLVTRQITKDKVSKFFVNGLASNLSKIKALFRSVHLNIENPHFLVKQGQITKIINLKPPELLGMIEETAGTAIYNKTKTESENMIKKKEIKLDSINQILRTSIMPQMEKLKNDRKKYTAFKEKEGEMKSLDQEIKLYELVTKRSLVQKKENELANLKDDQVNKKNYLQDIAQRLTQIQGQVKILRNKSSTTIHTQFMKISATVNEKKSLLNQLKKRLEKVQADSLGIKEELFSNEEVIERKKQDLQWKAKELINQEKQKEEVENLIRQINASKSQEDGIKILEKQLAQQRDQIKDIDQEIKAMNSKLQGLKQEETQEKKAKQQVVSTNQSLAAVIKELDHQIAAIEKLQPPKQVEDPELTNNYLQSLENEKKRMENQYFQLRTSYNDPAPNFDRKKVKGKMFSLFRVKDRNHEKALEIGAGGKLQNIVVESEYISKLVIEKDCFGKHVSVIPNNKIRFKEIKPEVINEAKKIAGEIGGLAKPAYELIQFDRQIYNSIMFAFSNFIVCSSTEIAKRIAYHPKQDFSCKCVTYDGDIFERGTLTGGHTNSNSLILGIYGEYRKIEQKISEERKKFEADKIAYNEYLQKISEYRKKKKEMEYNVSKREKMSQKLSDMSLNLKKKNYSEEIEAVKIRIQALKSQRNEHKKREEELMAKGKKGGKAIEEQRKEILLERKKQQLRVQDLKKASSLLELEIESLLRNNDVAKEGDNKNQQEILKLENKLRAGQKQLIDAQQTYEQLEQEKKKVEREQALSQSKLQFLLNEKGNLDSEVKKIENELQNIQREIESSSKIVDRSQSQIKEILEKCSWLDIQKQYEINPDFHYQNALRAYKGLAVDVDKLRKTAKITIDDHSYEKLQAQYESLLEKRSILEKDKITLLTNMHDLDDKRTKTLENCYEIVRENLGKIFNDLLPGATAHLTLIDPNDVTKGAELQVQFNKMKKQLSQLSGGQRSLLALSFILALLLYKPSPFYILDEIDSALDLSHTENIGYMISQRFPQSQFILISLKQGMFQNANVLYKVHFAQGESKVDRQVLKKK